MTRPRIPSYQRNSAYPGDPYPGLDNDQAAFVERQGSLPTRAAAPSPLAPPRAPERSGGLFALNRARAIPGAIGESIERAKPHISAGIFGGNPYYRENPFNDVLVETVERPGRHYDFPVARPSRPGQAAGTILEASPLAPPGAPYAGVSEDERQSLDSQGNLPPKSVGQPMTTERSNIPLRAGLGGPFAPGSPDVAATLPFGGLSPAVREDIRQRYRDGKVEPLQQALESGIIGAPGVAQTPGNPITGPTGASLALGQMTRPLSERGVVPGTPLSDLEAQRNYANSPADSRYMPGTTVGGRFGQVRGSAVTPGTPEYERAVANDIAAARQGSQREGILYDISHPGWRNSPLAPTAPKPTNTGPVEMTNEQKAQFAARRGLYYNPQTGVMGGTSRVMDLDRAQFERAAQLGEFPTGQRAKDLAPGSEYLQKNRENYLAQRNQRRSDIASGAFKTPAMKRAEAKERQQQTQFERQFAERNPAAAADVARTKALAAEGQAGRESRERMQKDLLASQERQNKERNDALVRSRGFDPSTGRELGASPLAPPVAALGDKVPQQVQQSARELANSGDVEGARQVLANSGVTDKAEQNKALQEMTGDPMAGLGFWERPVGPGLPGKAPMTRGQALRKLGRAFLPFPWNVAGQ